MGGQVKVSVKSCWQVKASRALLLLLQEVWLHQLDVLLLQEEEESQAQRFQGVQLTKFSSLLFRRRAGTTRKNKAKESLKS